MLPIFAEAAFFTFRPYSPLDSLEIPLGSDAPLPPAPGKRIHLSLLANPSHLEAVNTVCLGKVRCACCACCACYAALCLAALAMLRTVPLALAASRPCGQRGLRKEALLLLPAPAGSHTAGNTVALSLRSGEMLLAKGLAAAVLVSCALAPRPAGTAGGRPRRSGPAAVRAAHPMHAVHAVPPCRRAPSSTTRLMRPAGGTCPSCCTATGPLRGRCGRGPTGLGLRSTGSCVCVAAWACMHSGCFRAG